MVFETAFEKYFMKYLRNTNWLLKIYNSFQPPPLNIGNVTPCNKGTFFLKTGKKKIRNEKKILLCPLGEENNIENLHISLS